MALPRVRQALHLLKLQSACACHCRHSCALKGQRSYRRPAVVQAEPKVVFDDPSASLRISYSGYSYPDALGIEDLMRKVKLRTQKKKIVYEVGWPTERRQRMELATQNSYYVGLLEAYRGPEACQLVGLARVVSDGVLNAQLWDVVLDPDFQGMGLGEVLVVEIIQSLVSQGICNITTFAEKPGTKFFEKLGFQVDPDGVRAMIWRSRL